MGGSIIKFVREIPIMRRMIIKAGNRYFIYLPTEYNEIWEYLHKNKIKVNLIIEILMDDQSK
ncbi:MAG: hypothetical protein L7G98_05970 [Vulcanisaeta sp.]|nr:hypothetical protein [Vulcanisaeta sp.]